MKHFLFAGRAIAAALLSTAAAIAFAQSGEDAMPEPSIVGMSTNRLADIDAEFEKRVSKDEATGYVIVIAREGKIIHRANVGRQSIGGPRITQNTRFRIASMTKPITSVAVLRLVEQGRLNLTDPVGDYLPEIGQMMVLDKDGTRRAPSRQIQVRDLLTHMSGLGYRFDPNSELGNRYIDAAPFQKATSLEHAVSRISELDLFFDPGSRFLYSYGHDVAGRLVEVVSGEPFEAFLKAQIFDPLDMPSTGFALRSEDAADLATVYTKGEDGALLEAPGEVFGDPLGTPWPSGGAGLISTAADYIRFAMMLENNGSLDGVQVLSPASVAIMTADHTPAKLKALMAGTPLDGVGIGLGVGVVLEPGRTGKLSAAGDFAWGGYYDTQFFVSPEYDMAAVILTQYEKRDDEDDRDTLDVFKAMTLAAIKE